MATNTTNYNLVKPAYADTADIADINGNMDIIDGQMKTNADGVSANAASLWKTEEGLAVIVTGDTCLVSVPAGGYAYIKNNTHGLTEGLYRNKTGSAFPTSGGTANSTVFESVSRGGINALKSDIDTLNSKLTKQTSDNISTHSNIATVTSKIVKKSLDTIVIALDITTGGNEIPAWSVIATSNVIKPTEALTAAVTIANITASQMVFCSYLNFATNGEVTIPVALSANTRYIIRAVGI